MAERTERGAASSAEAGEGLWELPKGWRWQRAKEIAQIVGGGTPRHAADPSNYDENGTPWITPADLSGYTQQTISRGARNLSKRGLTNASTRVLPKGTVLISSRAPVGYCAVAANPVCTNQGFKSLVLHKDIDPFFIRYYILYSRHYLHENASGTTFKELSGAAMGELLFPIPPSPIQKKITNRIDELFSEIDEGESGLVNAHGGIGAYRKSLLNAAVTGELTADQRELTPITSGEYLRGRILAERRTQWAGIHKGDTKRYPEPVAPSVDDLPAIPDSWNWMSIDELSSPETGSISDGPFGSNLKSEHYRVSGPRVIRLGNIGREGEFVDLKAHIDQAHFASLRRHHIAPGDLAVAILGDPLPRAIVIPANFGPGLVKADCIKVRLSNRVYIPLVWAWLNSPAAHAFAKGSIKGIGRPRLSMDHIRSLPVPIPPPTEAKVLAGRLSAALAGAETLRERLEENDTKSATLRRSILLAAFKGELA